MAGNGGIIGPVNTVTAASCTPLSANVTQITASGDFTVQCAPLGGTRTGTVLVVAGGGGGGGSGAYYGGGTGGGAGGYRELSSQPLPTSAIPVTIGAGASGGSGGSSSANGSNTVLETQQIP